jgi:P27 family predicted phage terminase small subunit
MGKRGPRRIPTLLKELHGNPGKRALPVDEPQGVGDLWDPPVWFDDEQREQWRHALDHAPPGLLTGTDRAIFTCWVCACCEYARAVVQVRSMVQVVKTRNGNAIQNPYLSIMNRQATLINRLGSELGFSPSARASLGSAAPAFGDGSRDGDSLQDYIDSSPDKLKLDS